MSRLLAGLYKRLPAVDNPALRDIHLVLLSIFLKAPQKLLDRAGIIIDKDPLHGFGQLYRVCHALLHRLSGGSRIAVLCIDDPPGGLFHVHACI